MLAVSFLALGWRPGIVVAIAIPLVLAITFVVMKLAGISLQRISLGALIIGARPAGRRRHDRGRDHDHQARGRVRQDHRGAPSPTPRRPFPMLTGTLVTIAGFVPVGFAASGAGEYCFTLFAVVGDRADRLLDRRRAVHAADRRVHPARHAEGAWRHEPSRFSRCSTRRSIACCAQRHAVIGGTVALFVAVARRHAVRAAAVLSEPPTGPSCSSTSRCRRAPRSTRRARSSTDVEKILKADPDIEHWSLLCRQRRHPLLPAARRSSSPTTSSRRPSSSPRASRPRAGVQKRILERRCAAGASTTCWRASARSSSGRRSAGRSSSASAVRTRRRSRELRAELRVGARQQPERAQHQLRLERAVEGAFASRSTRTAPARSASPRKR